MFKTAMHGIEVSNDLLFHIYNENNNIFINIYCSDGRYYETVKANFERADRVTVVRTTTCCRVSPYHLLSNYNDLIFN